VRLVTVDAEASAPSDVTVRPTTIGPWTQRRSTVELIAHPSLPDRQGFAGAR